MAATLTSLAAAALDTNQSTTVNTASVTVSTSDVLLVTCLALMNSTNGTPTAVAGPGGLVFTQIGSGTAASADTNTRLSAWLGKATTGGSGAVTFTFTGVPTGPEGVCYTVDRIDGGVTTGTNGADAVVQSVTNAGNDPLSATLSALQSGNRAFAVAGGSGSGAQTCTWDFTERTDAAVNIGGYQCFSSTALSTSDSDPTPTATWTGTTYVGLIAIELASASTGVDFSGAATLGMTAAGQVQLASLFSGAGSIRTVAAGQMQVASLLNGAGSIRTVAAGQMQLASSFSGAGQLSVAASGQLNLASSMNAVGSIRMTSAGQLQLQSTLQGAAVLSMMGAGVLDYGITWVPGNAIIGDSSLGDFMDADLPPPDIGVAGAGSFGFTSGGQFQLSSLIGGAAVFSLTSSGALVVRTDFSGAAAFGLLSAGQLGSSSALLGAGSFGLSASGALQLSSGLSGAAAFALSGAAQMNLESILQGAASLGFGGSGQLDYGVVWVPGNAIIGDSSLGDFMDADLPPPDIGVAGAGSFGFLASGGMQLASLAAVAGSVAFSGAGQLRTTTVLTGAAAMMLGASAQMQLVSAVNGAASIAFSSSGALALGNRLTGQATFHMGAAGQLQLASVVVGAASFGWAAEGAGQTDLSILAVSSFSLGAAGQIVVGFTFIPPTSDQIVFCEADRLIVYADAQTLKVFV